MPLGITGPPCSWEMSRSRSYFTIESVNQYVLVSNTLVGLATRYYFLLDCCCLEVAVLFLCGDLSDKRAGLQFAVQSLNGPSHAEPVSMLYSLIWDSPTWMARFPYLYPSGTEWPSYTPGIGFPLRCLLRLAGLRWRYSNPPQSWRAGSPYIYSSGTGWSSPTFKQQHFDRKYYLVASPTLVHDTKTYWLTDSHS
jgi:hypothetical protein